MSGFERYDYNEEPIVNKKTNLDNVIDKIINKVQKVRAKNNKLWVKLLNISMGLSDRQLESMMTNREEINRQTMRRMKKSLDINPIKAKKLLNAINENDKKISSLLGEIK